MADSVIIRIDGDEREYELSLKNVEKQTEKTEKKIKSSMDTSAKVVSGLNKTVKGLALGIGAVGTAVIGMGVNYNAQIEQYTAGFTTMLGSAEKANETLENLRGFAEKTPFELTDLANASTTLLAFGEDVESLMPDLKILGDISLGNSEKFKSLALVFGQVQSQGKLMGQDLLQMINSGFNPLQVISEKTGESMSSLKDKMSKGQISFEMVAEAMRMATSEGGQFYNAMEAQSKTFQGQMSTLKDNITSLTGDIASDISEKLTDDVLPMLIEKVEQLKQAWADGSLQSAIGTATSGMVAFGVAVGGLNVVMLANDILEITKKTKDFTAATKLGTAAQKMMNAQLLKNPYTIAAIALTSLITGIITYAATHKSAAEEIIDSLDDINESYQNSIDTIDKNMRTEIAQAETAKTLKEHLFELEEQINSGKLTEEEATVAQEDFNITANKLNDIIPGIIDNIYDENGALRLQKEAVGTLTQSYYDLMVAKAMTNAYQEKINTAAASLIDAKEVKKQAEIEFNNAKGKRSGNGSIVGGWWGEHNVNETADALDEASKEVRKYETEIAKYVAEMGTYEKSVKSIIDGGLKNLKNATEEGDNVVDDSNAERTASTKKSTNDQEKILKEQREKELRDLQFAHEMGKLSDRDYYAALEQYRDKYFKESDEEWQKYTLEIKKYYDSLVSEIKKKQEDLASRLRGTEKKTFTKYTIVEGGKSQTYTMLADPSKNTQLIKNYDVLIEKFKEKYANIPNEIMEYLAEMDVNEGIQFVTALLNASEDEVNKYITSLQGEIAQAKATSEEIIPMNTSSLMADSTKNEYGQEIPKELFDIGKESAKQFNEGFTTQVKDDEIEEFRRALEEEFGQEVPEDFFDIGDESAKKFGEGFLEQLKGILQNIRQQIIESMSITPLAAYGGVGGIGGNISNSYTNTYTFNSSKDTTTQQLFAAQKASTISQLQGGS